MASVSGDRDRPAAATASSVGGSAERCPRCGSHNTKFCYYNNYNQAQPRHFCKACRRYWTLGGSLRDVPIGGSTRTTAHRSKQHTSVRSSSSRCRLLPAQAPATTYASPSSSSPASVNSLGSGALPTIPISVVPYTESTTTTVSGALVDEAGVFTPLLTEPPPTGFMALRDPFLHWRFDGFSLELGLDRSTTGSADQLSRGMGTEAVAWPSFGEDGGAGLTAGVHREGEAWQVVAGGAELTRGDGDDCFGWPELAFSATPGKHSSLQ